MHCQRNRPLVRRPALATATADKVGRIIASSLAAALLACADNPLPVAPPDITPAPNAVAGTTGPQVSVGQFHSCAITANGNVACWGYNVYGQTVVPPGTYSQLGTGFEHTCAVRLDGTIACWGFDVKAPTPAGTFTQVTGGLGHSCAVDTNRDITCWGENQYGQLGGPVSSPSTVTHAGPFTMVSAGYNNTCAIREDGSISCWGTSSGVGPPPATDKFIQLDTDWYQTCAVRVDGALACWGTLPDVQLVPQGTFTQVTTGSWHACALRTDRDIVCWGFDGYGEVSGTPNLDFSYQVYTHPGPFTHVSAGEVHTCAVRASGSLACWGAGTVNEGGSSTHQGQSMPPVLQQSQSITFTSSPPIPAFPGGTYTVTATGGSSSNPVWFSSITPAVCTFGASAGNASILTLIDVGTCTIAANQPGDGSHLDAPQVEQSFAVTYNFGASTGGGFASPVSNFAFNVVRAGQSVPIKFDLGGDHGLSVLAPGYPTSIAIACPSQGEPLNAVIETAINAGASTLSYDASTGLYTYVWKTNKAWAGTCRRFALKLDDETEAWATFQFTR